MSQHDFTVDNGAGVAVRADINLALKALASQSSGASAPSPTFPAQVWADTGTGRLKQRDAANANWVDKGPIDGAMAPLDSPVFTGQPQGNFPVVVGSVRNLRMSVTTASASGTMTADEVIVKASLGGLAYRIGSFSKAINLATTGAGGMDVGTAPVSGYVALYAIYNPITAASALLAVNATSVAAPNIYGGANMPSGYTASALLTVVATNASSQFVPVLVNDRDVFFNAISVLSTTAIVANLTALSIAAAAPLNAKAVSGTITISTGGAGTWVTTISGSAITTSTGVGLVTASLGSGSTSLGAGYPLKNIPLVTPQTIYYSTSTTAGSSSTSLAVSHYSI